MDSCAYGKQIPIVPPVPGPAWLEFTKRGLSLSLAVGVVTMSTGPVPSTSTANAAAGGIDTAKLLLQKVVRAFYGPRGAILIDQLIQKDMCVVPPPRRSSPPRRLDRQPKVRGESPEGTLRAHLGVLSGSARTTSASRQMNSLAG